MPRAPFFPHTHLHLCSPEVCERGGVHTGLVWGVLA